MPYVLNLFLKVVCYVGTTWWRKYRQFAFTSCWTHSRAFTLKLLSISSKQEYLTPRTSKPVESLDPLFSTNYGSIIRNGSKPFYLNSLCVRMSAIFWCFPKKIPWTVLSFFLALFHQKRNVHWPIMIISLINFQAVQ